MAMEVETSTGSVVVGGDSLELLRLFASRVQLGLSGALGVDTERCGFVPGQIPFKGGVFYQCTNVDIAVTSPSVVVVELHFCAEEMGKTADNALNWGYGGPVVGSTRLHSGLADGVALPNNSGGRKRDGVRDSDGWESERGESDDISLVAGMRLDEFFP